jgi:hypothetical protein
VRPDVAENNERLNELERSDRHSLIYGSVVGTVLLAVFACVFFILYVPGETREVMGTIIISFETIADNSFLRISRRVSIRLDDGHTVSARIEDTLPRGSASGLYSGQQKCHSSAWNDFVFKVLRTSMKIRFRTPLAPCCRPS